MSHKYLQIALTGALLALLSVPVWAGGAETENRKGGSTNTADSEKRRDEDSKASERRWTPIIPLGPLNPRLPDVPSFLESSSPLSP